jgi:hypothetical protein|tara:strand:- start:84 stop:542 length:459 start_codon:yes stop_codon:yes gene_type:complete
MYIVSMNKTSITIIKEGIDMSKNSKLNVKTPKVTQETDTTKSKEVKFTKKVVDGLLNDLSGFSSEEQDKIKDVMKTLQDKGKVTNGQGGGTSYDTPQITNFRNDYNKSVKDISDGFVVTKTGIKKHYVIDSNGERRFPMLYLRTGKELNKTK